MAASDHDRLQSGYLDWISQQRSDLEELLQILNAAPDGDPGMLRRLADKSIQHLHDYHQTRSISGQHHGGDAFFIVSPAWCTSLENSLFWIGGLKPSVFISLVYSISGSEFGSTDKNLSNLFKGGERNDGVKYSDVQLNMLKALHLKIISREDKISSRMADLQEDIGDEPVVMMAIGSGSREDVNRALVAHEAAVGGIVADADELRLTVLKELIDQILTPLQAIHLLVASNRLHLSIHQWGKRRRDHLT